MSSGRLGSYGASNGANRAVSAMARSVPNPIQKRTSPFRRRRTLRAFSAATAVLELMSAQPDARVRNRHGDVRDQRSEHDHDIHDEHAGSDERIVAGADGIHGYQA